MGRYGRSRSVHRLLFQVTNADRITATWSPGCAEVEALFGFKTIRGSNQTGDEHCDRRDRDHNG